MSNGNLLLAVGVAQALHDGKRVLIVQSRGWGLYEEILEAAVLDGRSEKFWNRGLMVTKTLGACEVRYGDAVVHFHSPEAVITRTADLRGRTYDFLVCHGLSPEEESRVQGEVAHLLLNGNPGLAVRG